MPFDQHVPAKLAVEPAVHHANDSGDGKAHRVSERYEATAIHRPKQDVFARPRINVTVKRHAEPQKPLGSVDVKQATEISDKAKAYYWHLKYEEEQSLDKENTQTTMLCQN